MENRAYVILLCIVLHFQKDIDILNIENYEYKLILK